MGTLRPFLGRQLDHDINLPPKFYQDRIKTHGAMLRTDRQTDRHTPITNTVVTYFFVKIFFREPIECFTDGKARTGRSKSPWIANIKAWTKVTSNGEVKQMAMAHISWQDVSVTA